MEIFQNSADLENQGSEQRELLQLLSGVPLVTKGIIDLIKGGAGRELGLGELSIPMGFSGVGGCSVSSGAF